MSGEQKLGLDDAYSVETPEDNIRLYADWASTYESDFVASNGYVGYLRVSSNWRNGCRTSMRKSSTWAAGRVCVAMR
ncbi:MAG: hypothetical protein OEM63_10990 [Gammaproteobacteria bacterium]|nr:hypothetical protein [Gammaproteobacteria bacterium]